MLITDRYQSLMDRAAGAAKPVEKTEKAGQGAKASAKAAASKASAGGVLDVNVSDRAQELASGAAKLDELKASIQNGTFRIDHDAIASRLVGEDF
jgi:anti-sigma28 factor (negative regulator of flagellin synthesis)